MVLQSLREETLWDSGGGAAGERMAPDTLAKDACSCNFTLAMSLKCLFTKRSQLWSTLVISIVSGCLI